MRPTRSLAIVSLPLYLACSGTVQDAPLRSSPGDERTPGTTARPPIDSSSSQNTAAPAACGPTPARLWKLTPLQYTRVAQTLVGAATNAGDDLIPTMAARKGHFSSEADVFELTEPHVTQLIDTAEKLAVPILTEAKKRQPCLGGASPDASCLRGFVEGLGAKAFRRPLTSSEVDTYAEFGRAQVTMFGAATGLTQLVAALLTSPSFLFRTELGPPDRPAGQKTFKLTAFERASALSFFLTGGPPDAELFAAAKDGRLESKEEIAAHTRRLLAGPSLAAGIMELLREQYDFAGVRTARKDPAVFPAWSSELANDVVQETELFLQDWLLAGGAKLPALLDARHSFLSPRVAAWYGLGAQTGNFKRTALPPERTGLLTQASVMASLATDDDTSPVTRGKYVRERLLCQELPAPPPDVNVAAPPPDGKRTQRERLAQHSADPACAGCHARMDPIGLAFETYDAVGRHRTTDAGKPIDASGHLTFAKPEGAAFANGAELGRLLASSPDVASCFVLNVFRYAYGRAEQPSDACAIAALSKRFEESGRDVMALLTAVTTDDAFFTRAAAP